MLFGKFLGNDSQELPPVGGIASVVPKPSTGRILALRLRYVAYDYDLRAIRDVGRYVYRKIRENTNPCYVGEKYFFVWIFFCFSL